MYKNPLDDRDWDNIPEAEDIAAHPGEEPADVLSATETQDRRGGAKDSPRDEPSGIAGRGDSIQPARVRGGGVVMGGHSEQRSGAEPESESVEREAGAGEALAAVGTPQQTLREALRAHDEQREASRA